METAIPDPDRTPPDPRQEPGPAERRARLIGTTLLLLGIAIIAVSSVAMAFRLAERNETDQPRAFATAVSVEPSFTGYNDIPFNLRLIETSPRQVEITWGDETERLLVGGREAEELPGLMRHVEWLSVMRIAEGISRLGAVDEQVVAGEIPDRMVVVARSVPPGMDPETWGAAKYKDNVYTFLELRPTGEMIRTEESYRELAGDVYSWKHVAAMKVTPGLNTPSSRSVSPISYPNYAGVREAMNAMGWTWPAFGIGALASLSGLIVMLTSFVPRRGA
jgi:hypothetical protein